MTWLDRVNTTLGAKLKAIVGAAFALGLTVIVSAQQSNHVRDYRHEQFDANLRLTRNFAAPLGEVLAAENAALLYAYMEIFEREPSAAGLAIVRNGQIVKSQQSLDYMDAPADLLLEMAQEASASGKEVTRDEGRYHVIGVPVLDSADRIVGAFALVWSMGQLPSGFWSSLFQEAALVALLGVVLLALLSAAVDRLVTKPLQEIAAAVEQNTALDEAADSEAAGKARQHQARRDEIGALARALQRFQERALDVQRLRLQLDAALNNMSQGLCMFDAARNLVVSNRRFAEIYGLSEATILPGVHVSDILRACKDAGNHSEDDLSDIQTSLEAHVAAQQPCLYLESIRDGRTVAVSQVPMQSGGWVATFEDITERKKAEAQIKHMAHHDALTGLPNRVLFRSELDRALVRTKRSGKSFSVLCLDLDHFKAVNDMLGHPVGDVLLQAVSERLRSCLREGSIVARLGGDEFAIIEEITAGVEEPRRLAERLIKSISAPYEICGHQVVIGTSIGIALAPTDGAEANTLIKAADLALYRAKADGRGMLCFFEREMDARMQERRVLEMELRKALPNGEFEVHYQPIISLETDKVSCFEALIRWHHPLRGLVPPSDFIPLAEEIGLIRQIGAWVLQQACSDAAQWPEDVRIAVNLSPAQFQGSQALVFEVDAALDRSGLAPERLELEITETVLLQNTEATLSILNQLRALGVRISMDDFGTGYSSLSYLRKFPFDKIKIDRSFVKDLSDGSDALTIIRAITGLGAGLGISTTAEGIETRDQLDTLRTEGCSEGQGY